MMQEAMLKLVGDAPLLMHNPAGMLAGRAAKKTIPTPEDEAAASCYWTKDQKSLCVYADHLHACFVKAASGYRIQGRRSVVPYLCGSLEIAPEEVPLKTKKYVVRDARSLERLSLGEIEGWLTRVEGIAASLRPIVERRRLAAGGTR